jgi:hypothetical protein
LVPVKLRSLVRNQTYGSRLTFGGRMTDRSVRLPIYSLHSSRKMAFEQRMDIVLTYWHWLEYDSVAVATLCTGIGLLALLVLSI